MRILLSNDDGFAAAGLEALADRLSAEHELYIVAPDRERSGVSHATTFREHVLLRQVTERGFSCSGTPADCVLYSLLGAIEFAPEVVISGINYGANLGSDIIYSGTAAAARQAALMHVPGVAVSLVTMERTPDFSNAARIIAEHLPLLTSLWDEAHFINVNVPDPLTDKAQVFVTRPARRIYDFSIVEQGSDNGERAFALRGTAGSAREEGRTDWDAIQSGNISISPVSLHPSNDARTEPRYADRMAAFASGRNTVEFG